MFDLNSFILGIGIGFFITNLIKWIWSYFTYRT